MEKIDLMKLWNKENEGFTRLHEIVAGKLVFIPVFIRILRLWKHGKAELCHQPNRSIMRRRKTFRDLKNFSFLGK